MQPRHRSVPRRAALALGAVCLLPVAAAGVLRRDQIIRYATHWKGSPTSTEAWTPFPAGDPPELHLVAAGDVGDSGARLSATAAAVTDLDDRLPVDDLLLLGDNVYPAGDPDRLPDTVLEPFAAVLSHADLYAILGNHDVKEGHAAAQVQALGMPGRWWAATRGEPRSARCSNVTASSWCSRATTTTTSAASPSGASPTSSAAPPRVPAGPGRDAFTAVSFSWHHFVEIAVWPDRLVLRAINQDLRVADEAVLSP